MSIDCDDFKPTIEPDQFPEAFDPGANTSFQLECHCFGNGPCSCFNDLQDKPHHRITIEAMLEREIEDQSNSFASNDNSFGIDGIQMDENDRINALYGVSAPKTSADKHMKEPLLIPAIMDFGAETEIISDGSRQSNETNGDETKSCNSGETNWSAIEVVSLISSDETDSNITEEIVSSTIEEDGLISNDKTDSDTTEEHNSTATKSIPGVGMYQIEETSSDGFLCGMYALEISTKKQLAGGILTPAIFDDIFRSPEMQAFNWRKGYENTKDFYDEQLACVLEIWGRREGHGRLQLGLILEGNLCYIVGAEDKMIFVESEVVMENELNLGFTTIWIHNNNVMSRESAVINHYSGVTLLETNEEQVKTEREEAEQREENADKHEAVLERLEATRRPLEESQEQGEPQKKRRKFQHGS